MEKSLCIVLRASDYRDNDKMLTLFSRTEGRLDALSRGCKKPLSSLLACSQPFTCGLYSYYIRQGRHYISQCEITDSFYALREDIKRLAAASFIAEACEKAISHDEPNERLFSLCAHTFFALKNNADALSALLFFMVRFSDISGYRPNIYTCVECGRRAKKKGNYFSSMAGGILCGACSSKYADKTHIAADALLCIDEILKTPVKNISQFEKEKDILFEPVKIFIAYSEEKLDRKISSAEFLLKLYE